MPIELYEPLPFNTVPLHLNVTSSELIIMMYLKKHQTKEGTIVAVCDKELLNQSFESGDIVLNVKEDFYGNELVMTPENLQKVTNGEFVAITK